MMMMMMMMRPACYSYNRPVPSLMSVEHQHLIDNPEVVATSTVSASLQHWLHQLDRVIQVSSSGGGEGKGGRTGACGTVHGA